MNVGNLYAYAGNNPVNMRDPMGLTTWCEFYTTYDTDDNIIDISDFTRCWTTPEGPGVGGGPHGGGSDSAPAPPPSQTADR